MIKGHAEKYKLLTRIEAEVTNKKTVEILENEKTNLQLEKDL